jgi:hypothetical protein
VAGCRKQNSGTSVHPHWGSGRRRLDKGLTPRVFQQVPGCNGRMPPWLRGRVGVAASGGIRYSYYMLRFLDTVTTLPLPAWTLPAHSPKATHTCLLSILFSVSYHFLWHPFALLSHITARVSCLAPQSFCNSTEVRTLIPLLCIPQIAYYVP